LSDDDKSESARKKFEISQGQSHFVLLKQLVGFRKRTNEFKEKNDTQKKVEIVGYKKPATVKESDGVGC